MACAQEARKHTHTLIPHSRILKCVIIFAMQLQYIICMKVYTTQYIVYQLHMNGVLTQYIRECDVMSKVPCHIFDICYQSSVVVHYRVFSLLCPHMDIYNCESIKLSAINFNTKKNSNAKTPINEIGLNLCSICSRFVNVRTIVQTYVHRYTHTQM